MLVHASLYPISPTSKRITEHRKMCVRDKTAFSNLLSIVKSSINYYSATYWILNLYTKILLCNLNAIAFFLLLYIWFPWMGKHKNHTWFLWPSVLQSDIRMWSHTQIFISIIFQFCLLFVLITIPFSNIPLGHTLVSFGVDSNFL